MFDTWNRDGTLQAILDRLRGQVKIDEELWCIESCEVTQTTCATTGGLWNPGGSCPDRLFPGDGKHGPGSRDE